MNIGDIDEEILLKSVLDTVSDGVTVIDRNLREPVGKEKTLGTQATDLRKKRPQRSRAMSGSWRSWLRYGW